MPPTSTGYCFAHDPERATERQEAASKGGRAGRRYLNPSELPELDLGTIRQRRQFLEDLARWALAGQVPANIISPLAGLVRVAAEDGRREQPSSPVEDIGVVVLTEDGTIKRIRTSAELEAAVGRGAEADEDEEPGGA